MTDELSTALSGIEEHVKALRESYGLQAAAILEAVDEVRAEESENAEPSTA